MLMVVAGVGAAGQIRILVHERMVVVVGLGFTARHNDARGVGPDERHFALTARDCLRGKLQGKN